MPQAGALVIISLDSLSLNVVENRGVIKNYHSAVIFQDSMIIRGRVPRFVSQAKEQGGAAGGAARVNR